MLKVFRDADADVSDLTGETAAIIGYGIQGRAQALNLRDSGIPVVVGNRADEYRARAEEEGFEALGIGEAVERGDLVLLLIPDEAQPELYREVVHPRLRPGSALVFAHGFAVRYGLVEPPAGVDVLLLAPRMPGRYVRERFLAGGGAPAFVDVGHDASGRGWKRVLGLAKGIGATRAGALAVTFAQETELDHFSEHFIYPLVLGALALSFEVLVESGYPPEVAVMELYGSHELGEVLVEAGRIGLFEMLDRHASPACRYGIHTHLGRLADAEMRARIREVLGRIHDGSFAAELVAEQAAGYPRLHALEEGRRRGPLAEAERALHDVLRLD